VKVVRVVLLWKLLVQQVKKSIRPMSGVELVMVDRKKVDRGEVYRTAGLFFAWIFLLLCGSLTTAALSPYGAMESASGMFSALGNIGPAYISVEGVTQLNPVIKVVYILGMLAGRLELLPVLMLFSRRSWQ
jgi:trk system potassium uptake protein TrkH